MRRGKKLLSTLTAICMMVSSLLINSVLPGSVINVQASGVENETVNVPFELDFNDLTVDTVPEGWTEDAKHASQDAGRSSMTVVDDSPK